MSNKKTIDEILKETFKNENKANKQKKNKKSLILVIVAAVAAGVIVLTSGIIAFVRHFSKKQNPTGNSNTSSISMLADIGDELEFPEEPKPKYGETTGKVDVNKIVEKNGKIYVDQESANKSDKVGTSSVDTKGDTLKVESDGTVKEKTDGYEIKDKETGSVIQSGNVSSDGSIDGFEKNEELGGTYEEKDNTDDLVRADSNYYNEEGTCVIRKGDLLSKETLEYAKANLSTVAQVSSSNVSSSVSSNTSSNTSSSTTGVTNPDGTYTIGGITYLSKADYQQCILDGYEGYAIIDGIMQPIPQQLQMQKTK